MRDDEPPPRPPPTHAVGEPLDTLSVAELADRVALLRAEIERIEAARARKLAAAAAADSVFGKGV